MSNAIFVFLRVDKSQILIVDEDRVGKNLIQALNQY